MRNAEILRRTGRELELLDVSDGFGRNGSNVGMMGTGDGARRENVFKFFAGILADLLPLFGSNFFSVNLPINLNHGRWNK